LHVGAAKEAAEIIDVRLVGERRLGGGARAAQVLADGQARGNLAPVINARRAADQEVGVVAAFGGIIGMRDDQRDEMICLAGLRLDERLEVVERGDVGPGRRAFRAAANLQELGVASASVREANMGGRVDCRSILQQEDDRWRDRNRREPS
jgi:hypothetical protein